VLLAVLMAAAPVGAAHADSASVTAVLTNSETIVGQPVQLEIKVTGASNAKAPNIISVDGLDIRYSGQSQMLEGRNFQFNYSFVYNYTVMPLRAGSFTIPAQTIQVGGKSLKTPELKLDVVNASGSTGRPSRAGRPQQQQPIDEKQIAFAELIVTKKTAYVGEMVPVEIRLGFHSRVPARLTSPPEISGQGFTAQKMPEAQQKPEMVNGIPYNVLTFKTAIAAARTGKFEIGPVTAKALIQLPRRFGPTRSPLDLFNMDDPFADPFFRDAFDLRGEQREIELKSEPATLDVKPLPPNAPPGFSGAVGSFTIAADVNPKSAQLGDPLTVTTTITGRGNFDRVAAPALEDDRGWHKYPPSSNFKADDDVGISGTKTFETVLSPNENKSAIPAFAFTYFDPVKEKYVTLRSEEIPVRIAGGTAPVATPSPTIANQQSTAAKSPAPAAATPAEVDILYQLTDRPTWVHSFRPVYAQQAFWFVQGIPLLGLLGFCGWKVRQKRAGDRAAQRVAALQHEASELERNLRRDDVKSDTYFAEAARAIQLKAALAKGLDPNAVDAQTAATAFGLSDDQRVQMQELFRKSDELRYSGHRGTNGAVLPETRRQVMHLLDSLQV
jgi:hypothetical protein